MTIHSIQLRQIFDSRGEPTIEIELLNEKGKSFRASVPSGKSRGSKEATVFGLSEAHVSVRRLSDAIKGKSFDSIRALDEIMMGIDGTSTKSNIGGNVMLGISIAGARMLAEEEKMLTWEYIRREFFKNAKEKKYPPLIFSNVINGGAHAKNNLSIQEYMLVVRTKRSYAESISKLIAFYKHLGEELSNVHSGMRVPIGDEGGYAVNFKNNFEPIAMLEKYLSEEDAEGIFSVGIDVAASSFFDGDTYNIDGKLHTREELLEVYKSYFKQSKLLCTIEDPFAESDPDMFAELLEDAKTKWIVGDDLTVTSAGYIKEYGEKKCINGVIIKPNQIGSVSEACEAIRLAQDKNIKTIVSHRSGETEDVFIIELAKAGCVDGVKIGAPTKERILKFNELIRLFN